MSEWIDLLDPANHPHDNTTSGLAATNVQAALTELALVPEYADDTAASVGGVPIGGLYHTAGVAKVRVT